MMMYTAEQFIEGQLVLINKPKTWTSFDVIAKLRGPLRKFCNDKNLKLGHAGTLDPMATGLLVIATGRFTKKISTLQDLDKTYTGTIRLGGVTPSYDADTPVTIVADPVSITAEDILSASKQFIGVIEQIPPQYSSIKTDGERAYKKAREGETVIMKSRQVRIDTFDITSINIPDISFSIACSKGTYIRSIAHDIGQILGCGGYLVELTRTRIGDYSLDDALTIEAFLRQISL